MLGILNKLHLKVPKINETKMNLPAKEPENILVQSQYLPAISHFAVWLGSAKIFVDQFSPFKKSTGRNRCYLASPNGLLRLSVPVLGGRKVKDAMKEVLVAENDSWKRIHWGAMFSNYGKSAYFHFYEDEFKEVFFRKTEELAGFNLSLLKLCVGWLDWKISIEAIDEENALKHFKFMDLREKEIDFKPAPYRQVFEERTGYLANASIIDLIFNLGPQANEYLLSQKPCAEILSA